LHAPLPSDRDGVAMKLKCQSLTASNLVHLNPDANKRAAITVSVQGTEVAFPFRGLTANAALHKL